MKPARAQRAVPLTTAALLAPALAAAQSTNLASLNPPLPDVGFSVFRVLGALAVVLALFLGGAWLFRNWQRLTLYKGQAPKLKVLEVRSLGHRHALYVVAYEQQRLMLASSPTGVSLLTHLPAADTNEPEPAAPTFAEALQGVLAGKT
jgi:flagellar biogenesis protein FliO